MTFWKNSAFDAGKRAGRSLPSPPAGKAAGDRKGRPYGIAAVFP